MIAGRRGRRPGPRDGSRWALVMAVLGVLAVLAAGTAQIVDKQKLGTVLWLTLVLAGLVIAVPPALSQSRWGQERSKRRRDQNLARYRVRQDTHTKIITPGEGVARPDWDGSYFTGRARVLTDLISWLNDPSADRIRVVVGLPGSGKSAVLGRLLILADPGRRRPAEDRAGLPAVTGTIDCAVHARAKDGTQLLGMLADGLGRGIETVDDLLLAVQQRGRPLTVLIDGVDEAVEPERIARTLLRPIVDGGPDRIRLLLGTRRHLLPLLGVRDGDVVDLDSEAYFRPEDVADYAQRWLLLESEPDAESPYRADPALARSLAEAIAARAGRAFLVAQLTARALARDQAVVDLDREGWDEAFPSSVGTAMDVYLTGADGGDRSRELLTPLAFAEGAELTPGPLWAALATALGTERYDVQDVRRLVYRSAAVSLLHVDELDRGQKRYRLFHEALGEHLRSVVPHPAPEQEIVDTLIRAVPGAADDEPRWSDADPYVRDHLSDHAVRAGCFAELARDAGFLLAAAPDSVLRALSADDAPAMRRLATVYRSVAHDLRRSAAADAASLLELHARQQGADELADRVAALGRPRRWSTRWARCRPVHPHQVLGRHDGEVKAVTVVTVAGRPVVVAADSECTVAAWDLTRGAAACAAVTVPDGEVNAVAAVPTPDGPAIAVGGDSGLWIWRPGTATLRRLGDATGVSALAVAGNPAVVAAGGFDGAVRLWDPESGTPVGDPMPAHAGGVQTVAVGHADGRLMVVSGGFDGAVAFRDPAGDELRDAGQAEPIVAVDLADRTVTAGSLDGAVRSWRLPNGAPEGITVLGDGGWLSCLALARGADRLIVVAGGLDGTVQAWDGASGTRLAGPLVGHDGWVSAAAAADHQGRTLLVTGGLDGTVRSWDLAEADLPAGTPDAHQGAITAALSATYEGRLLAVSGGTDGTVRGWDAGTGEPAFAPILAHEPGVGAVAASVVGGRLVLATGGHDGTVQLWDAADGTARGPAVKAHQTTVRTLSCVDLGGRRAVVSGGDGGWRRWAAGTGEPIGDPVDAGRQVRCLVLDQVAGRTVAVAGGDGGWCRWDLVSGEPIGEPFVTDGPVRALATAVIGGRQQVLVGGDGGWRRWDLATGEAIGAGCDVDRQVRSLAVLTIAGRKVAAAGHDRGLSVRHLSDRGAQLHIELGFAVTCVAGVAESDLLVGSYHGLLRLRLHPDNWQEAPW